MIKASVVAVILSALPVAALADCSRAPLPELPDPHAATLELMDARAAVQQYLDEQQTFLECVRNLRLHNSAVEEMHSLADRFNQLLRAYRARQNNEAWDSYFTTVFPEPLKQHV